MRPASQHAYAGGFEGHFPHVFSHAADTRAHAAAPAVRPHAKNPLWGDLLFAAMRLAPAMVWFGNFGWNR